MGEPAPARTPHAKAISLAVAVAIAAVLLYYSVRGIDWRQVGRTIANASPGLLVLSAGMMTVTLFLRACRWRILLNAEGHVTVPAAFWATAAGLFGNNFLPARGGELVRTFMISARSALSTPYVLATAVSERVADAIVLVVVSALVLLFLPDPPGWLAHAARPFAIAGLLGAVVIIVLPLLGSAGRAAIEMAPLPHASRARLARALDEGLRGMRAFHDLRRVAGFLALTAVIWYLDALATVVGGAALGFRIPLSAAFLLIAGLGVASALPSTPGYVGIYQFVAVSMLTPFGFSRTDAIAYILVAQVFMYIVIGFWGALGLARYRRERRSA
jgi:glycosyltransferase 2 family protein